MDPLDPDRERELVRECKRRRCSYVVESEQGEYPTYHRDLSLAESSQIKHQYRHGPTHYAYVFELVEGRRLEGVDMLEAT